MKTASERRRTLNTRVRARDHLPVPAVRLQPKRVATEAYKTQWAKHLSGRIGWHGLYTRTRKIVVLLMNNGCVTYYIDLEPNRVSGEELTYALTRNFDLESQLHPLVELDAIHADSEVLGAFNFGVEAKATADGDGARVIVWAERGLRITAPLRKRKRGTDTAHGEELAEDEEDTQILEDIVGLTDESAVF